jgi:hypothetical protein
MLTEGTASHQEQQQHRDPAEYGQDRHRAEKCGVEIGKQV